MKENPLKEGDVTVNAAGVGTVTREMVRERAIELARINGRSRNKILQADLDQAWRELTGQSEVDPKESALESIPESERWEPVPGSKGRKAAVNPSDDDDAEGRSDRERITDEGIAAAEHDQMVRATRAARRKDRKGR